MCLPGLVSTKKGLMFLLNNVSDVTAIILCSMGFGINCVFAYLISYEGLRPKARYY